MAGIAPEIEEREAALFNGYNWREWCDLPYDDRVDGVAHFRLHHLIQLLQAEIEGAEIDRRSRMRGAD